MIRISKITLATAIGLALSGTALAQPDRSDQGQFQGGQSQASGAYKSYQSSEHGQKAQREMQALDRNRDQRLDRQEAQTDPELIAAWAEVDVSRDGSVDATEYYLFAANRTISEMERASGAQSSAARSGAGNAGNVGAQGQNQGQGQAQGRGRGQQSQGGFQSRDGQQQGQPGQQSQQNQGGFQSRVGGQQETSPSFDDADLNSDGEISRTELMRAEGAGFAALDTNNDGQIDRQEYSRIEGRTLNN